MQLTASFAALLLTVAPLASAHLILQGSFAPRFPADPQGPLKATGDDYPCSSASYSGAAKSIAKGQQQQIQLLGSVVHGGGSCQVSITYDKAPGKNSRFTVIKSFQGKCPTGQYPGNITPDNPALPLPGLPYQIPADAPEGDAILAWTWFNKVGNREMYMRCAPIKITGSGGDKAKFESRPEILKANIGNGCSTKEGDEVNFPNPGSDVVGQGTGAPVGNCGPSGPSGGKSSSGPAAAPAPQAPAPQAPTPQAPTPMAPAPATGGGCSGSIVCDSATSWSMCSNGVKIPMGAVAAGTKCVNGAITKRSISRRRRA